MVISYAQRGCRVPAHLDSHTRARLHFLLWWLLGAGAVPLLTPEALVCCSESPPESSPQGLNPCFNHLTGAPSGPPGMPCTPQGEFEALCRERAHRHAPGPRAAPAPVLRAGGAASASPPRGGARGGGTPAGRPCAPQAAVWRLLAETPLPPTHSKASPCPGAAGGPQAGGGQEGRASSRPGHWAGAPVDAGWCTLRHPPALNQEGGSGRPGPAARCCVTPGTLPGPWCSHSGRQGRSPATWPARVSRPRAPGPQRLALRPEQVWGSRGGWNAPAAAPPGPAARRPSRRTREPPALQA